MLRKSSARFVAVVAGAVFALGAAGTASAQSVADLQAQIQALMAQLAALQGGSSTSASVSFTTDLTIGSTGPQVVALQDFLISKGYLVMPAGVAKGYFGELTRAAVAKYQVAMSITPAAGYWGPLTRTKANAGGGAGVGVGIGVGIGIGTGNGEEGQLVDMEEIGSIGNETLEEGDEEAEVLGIEFEAEDSDMSIDRVDVDFEVTDPNSGSSSERLDRYVDNVSLWLNGKKLADADVDEADKDGDLYSFRFTGLRGVVKEGDVAELIVAVDILNNVDGNDEGSEITVTIPEDGIRATDTAGISDTYFNSAASTTFTVEGFTAGDVSVSESRDNPDAMDVEVDDERDTSGVELLVFEIETDDSDITIEDLPVTIRTTGATNAEVFKNVQLYKGSKLVKTKSVTSTSASSSVTFDNIDITIDADSTETFTIKATVNDTEGNFADGDSASTTVYGALIDAENERGDSVTVDGRADGENMTFRVNGIAASLVSVTESVTTSDNAPDLGTYVFKFKVDAFGEDMYLSATSTAAGRANAATIALTGATAASSTLSCAGCDTTGSGSSKAFIVDEGTSEEFTLTVVVTGAANFASVEVTDLKWGTAANATTANTTTVEDWESDPVYLSNS